MCGPQSLLRVIASAAKQSRICPRRHLDCFAALAMTVWIELGVGRPNRLAESPRHPDCIFDAIRPLPACGERRRVAELNQLPLRQVLHQRADAERPGLALVAGAHAVDELAELGRCDRDDIVALVGEALPRRVAILDRREHGAEEQRKAIGILMHRPDGLRDEVGGIAADLADRGMAVEDKTVLRPSRSGRRPSCGRRRAKSCRRTGAAAGRSAQEALLSLAFDNSSAERPSKSRRLTSLPSVAPTILPRLDTTSTTSGSGLFQVDFGCRPASMPVPTDDIVGALVKTSASGPMPTSRYWLQAFCSISTCFSCIASGRARLELRQIVADQPHHFLADRFGRGRIAARPLLDHALQHRDGKGDAGGLQRPEDRAGASSHGFCRIAPIGRRVGDDALRDRRCARPWPRQRLGRIVFLAERADGRKTAR